MLLILKILGFVLAGLIGILSIMTKTRRDDRHGVPSITKSGWFLLTAFVISIGLAASIEFLDQSNKLNEKSLDEKWRQINNQEIVGFGYDLLFKDNIPVYRAMADHNFAALEVNTIFDEENYLFPPGVAFAMFLWSEENEEGQRAENWSATFDLSSDIEGVRSVFDLPQLELDANPIVPKRHTSYLWVNPSINDDVVGKFVTPRNKTYGIMKKVTLDAIIDEIGGLSGRGEWRPLGLTDSVKTIQDLPRIRRVRFLMSSEMANERVDCVALSFTTNDGTEMKGFFYDLALNTDDTQTGYIIASISGTQLYNAIKERFDAIYSMAFNP